MVLTLCSITTVKHDIFLCKHSSYKYDEWTRYKQSSSPSKWAIDDLQNILACKPETAKKSKTKPFFAF